MEGRRLSLVEQLFKRIKNKPLDDSEKSQCCLPYDPCDVTDTFRYTKIVKGDPIQIEQIRLKDGRLFFHDITHHTFFG